MNPQYFVTSSSRPRAQVCRNTTLVKLDYLTKKGLSSSLLDYERMDFNWASRRKYRQADQDEDGEDGTEQLMAEEMMGRLSS